MGCSFLSALPKPSHEYCPAADCSPRGSACRNEPHVHAVRQDANPDHWQGSELSVTILGSWQYYRAKVRACQPAPRHSAHLNHRGVVCGSGRKKDGLGADQTGGLPYAGTAVQPHRRLFACTLAQPWLNLRRTLLQAIIMSVH